jgi:uncharacterized damage-inducible protein DinB
MKITKQIAEHFHQAYFGGNWTSSSLKEAVSELNWEDAKAKPDQSNSILGLVFHINYYVHEVGKVLNGGVLEASDKRSFDFPEINNQEEWTSFLNGVWEDGSQFVALIEKLPDSILYENFTDQRYGSYFRNLMGIIEHTHYHVGQIVLLVKQMKSV